MTQTPPAITSLVSLQSLFLHSANWLS